MEAGDSMFQLDDRAQGIYFNYTSIDEPNYSENQTSFFLDATFSSNKASTGRAHDHLFDEMPIHLHDTGNSSSIAQMFISEYTFQTAMSAFHEKGLINQTMSVPVAYV